jgi:hypothetical protein
VIWLNKSYETFKNIDGVRVIDEDTLEPLDEVATTTNVAPMVPAVNVPLVLGYAAAAPVPVLPAPVAPDPIVNPVNQTLPVLDDRVQLELTRLGADPSDVDMSKHRSLRSGRVLDEGNVVVSLSDICCFAKGIFHNLSVNFSASFGVRRSPRNSRRWKRTRCFARCFVVRSRRIENASSTSGFLISSEIVWWLVDIVKSRVSNLLTCLVLW